MKKILTLIMFFTLSTGIFAEPDIIFRQNYSLPIYYYHYVNYVKPNPGLREVRTFTQNKQISDFGTDFFDQSLNFRKIDKDTYLFQEGENLTKVVFLEKENQLELNIFQHSQLINKVNIIFEDSRIKTICTDTFSRGELTTRRVDDYFYNSKATKYIDKLPTSHISKLYNNKLAFLDGFTKTFTIERGKYIATKEKGSFTIKEIFSIKGDKATEYIRQVIETKTGKISNVTQVVLEYDRNGQIKSETRSTNNQQTFSKRIFEEGDFIIVEIKSLKETKTFKLDKRQNNWTECTDNNLEVWYREYLY
ncbi:MAG: hypothetical protein JXR63_08675 [Spirochaetales bacterium]|nr:hypothetical protein [Spirochaetales bacterium]